MDSQNKKCPGRQSLRFPGGVYVRGIASVAGKLEGEGPLGAYFDIVQKDPMFGGSTWEEAESNMLCQAVEHAIKDAGLLTKDIRFVTGGDLLGQLIATTFGVESMNIPLLGLYGACSTMGESLLAAAVFLEGGFCNHMAAVTSSHFAGAEKQFRFPLAYGNQRPMAATWTVTGSGAVVLSRQKAGYNVRLTAATMGRIVDYGVKDSMNMGACMAPAACDTISRYFEDTGEEPKDFDCIATGDLGVVGKEILLAMLSEKGYELGECYMDCGIEIFDPDRQGTDAGGSGCGCAAITLTGYLLRKVSEGAWKRLMFVPTGALLSSVSFNEGNSVPGIAHAIIFEHCEG